ncbi:nitroreductase/quinone reductase family protein [Jiangella endophytica]|uniref:nitroreductase/quinone reductase family protein n=1 Tax=Jiangella endophytica TaxID=1623398 RepID=UPI00130068C7|nr:nitroreductase/quinone reductase family protein [Jiangella endophytica]
MLPGLDDTATATARRRLDDETEIWITTVRVDGQPQTSLVGFLRDGDSVLVLSQPGAAKLRNLRANPRVSLHLDTDRTDGAGGGVLTLEGEAAVEEGPLDGDEAARYVDRYRAVIEQAGATPDDLLAGYSAVIRVTPTRVRLY